MISHDLIALFRRPTLQESIHLSYVVSMEFLGAFYIWTNTIFKSFWDIKNQMYREYDTDISRSRVITGIL